MISSEKRSRRARPLACALMSLLVMTFFSCGGEESGESQAPDIAESQAKIEQLEKELAGKERQIAELQKEKTDLAGRIPVPDEVQKGDSHWAIAYRYLTQQKGLSPEEAEQKLSKALLYHPVLVGFQIWNFLSDGTFGTVVTRGSAAVSPGTLLRLEKKGAIEEKAGLENRIAGLQSQNQELAAKMDKIRQDHQVEKNKLDERITALEKDLKEAQGQSRDLEAELNSVYYMAGSKDRLKDDDKIKGTFLGLCGTRIKDVTQDDFGGRIDLRETDRISLDASGLGVSRINKIGLLPKHLEEGKDYRVEVAADRRIAAVFLLDKDKFRLARLILYVN